LSYNSLKTRENAIVELTEYQLSITHQVKMRRRDFLEYRQKMGTKLEKKKKQTDGRTDKARSIRLCIVIKKIN